MIKYKKKEKKKIRKRKRRKKNNDFYNDKLDVGEENKKYNISKESKFHSNNSSYDKYKKDRDSEKVKDLKLDNCDREYKKDKYNRDCNYDSDKNNR